MSHKYDKRAICLHCGCSRGAIESFDFECHREPRKRGPKPKTQPLPREWGGQIESAIVLALLAVLTWRVDSILLYAGPRLSVDLLPQILLLVGLGTAAAYFNVRLPVKMCIVSLAGLMLVGTVRLFTGPLSDVLMLAGIVAGHFVISLLAGTIIWGRLCLRI